MAHRGSTHRLPSGIRSRPFTTHPHYPILHSLQVLFSFFLLRSILLFNFPLSSTSNLYPTTCPVVPGFTYSPLYQPVPNSSVCSSLDWLPISFLSYHSITLSGLKPRRHSYLFCSILLLLSGDIQVNPGPVASFPSINLAHLNTRSVSSITAELNKSAALLDFISDKNIDILALSETWLTSDSPLSTLNSITPLNYSFFHEPRLNATGGGVGIIFRSCYNMTKISLPTFTSFEAICTRLTFPSCSFVILTIYRPPSSSTASFISDFSTLLEDLIATPSELILLDDFNFHVDLPLSPIVSPFINLLNTFDLTQHINFPTHSHLHTPDQ